jgi:hypothetical protein
VRDAPFSAIYWSAFEFLKPKIKFGEDAGVFCLPHATNKRYARNRRRRRLDTYESLYFWWNSWYVDFRKSVDL